MKILRVIYRQGSFIRSISCEGLKQAAVKAICLRTHPGVSNVQVQDETGHTVLRGDDLESLRAQLNLYTPPENSGE
jgi:hypothetical protein